MSLYTSRVVLQTLGETDYGVYGLVGTIVTLFTFLNTSMSGATSRFLTYEIGKGNKDKLKETFSTAMSIHIVIAIAIKTYIPGVAVCIICEYANTINGKFLHLIVTTIISTLIIGVYSFYVLCKSNERKAIVNFVTTKLHLRR